MISSTEINLDDVLNSLALLKATKGTPESFKDALGLLLPEHNNFELDDLVSQVEERSEALVGLV